MMPDVPICTPVGLPPALMMPAAETACALNPANRPATPPGVELKPGYLALLTSKWWGAGGVRLTVGFMESLSVALRDRILSHMNAWGAFSNVKFSWTQQSPQVRISRGPGGYYSYLGTDVLHIPATQQTMNLEAFTMGTPESEFVRVVRHETGHTLGFPHEHLRRELVARLDPQKTVAYFERTQGWTALEVTQQVLTPLEDAALTRSPQADEDSIMCYQLPGEVTVDGRPIVGGVDIDATDRALAARVYPPAGQPTAPPAGGAVELPARLAVLDASGQVLLRLTLAEVR